MKRTIIFLALMFLGCTNESATRETLRKAGFTDVQITGWEPFQCSDDDNFSTGFRARNAQGESVGGVVCCGLLKSCTVRF